MAACAAVLDPVQADAYLPAQEQFDSIISHLRSTDRMTHRELTRSSVLVAPFGLFVAFIFAYLSLS